MTASDSKLLIGARRSGARMPQSLLVRLRDRQLGNLSTLQRLTSVLARASVGLLF